MAPIRTPEDPDLLWNVLTLLVWLGIGGVLLLVGVIYVNPNSPVNPFPPRPLPTLLSLPTLGEVPSPTPWSTETVLKIPPTPAPSATLTPEPTLILATPLPEQSNPIGTPTSPYRYAFAVQGKPNAISAALYYPERTCDWTGVAGRVFDIQGSPAIGIRVSLQGYLGGKSMSLLSLTGTASLYGPSGFEFTLADRPLASRGTLYIQLLDQADLPLSPQIAFDTFAECDKNLILIDFKQVR
ncbi:hypothetical protein [uncultured Thermanaerothrix sp.]|uniref:hypothetical protein n=1 Tax=uncultured Thermanaerothrix sp. TaxID=1195149 RepID=UPI00261733CB|nr:hypothetical protein [uncultured Thermanaerothrix sp.]